jgi:hypothetical protein
MRRPTGLERRSKEKGSGCDQLVVLPDDDVVVEREHLDERVTELGGPLAHVRRGLLRMPFRSRAALLVAHGVAAARMSGFALWSIAAVVTLTDGARLKDRHRRLEQSWKPGFGDTRDRQE